MILKVGTSSVHRLLSYVAICAALLLDAGGVGAKTPTKVKADDVIRVLKLNPDPSPRDFASAGSGVGGVLADLLGRGRLDEELRTRAARALGRFPCEKTSIVLGVTVSDKTAPSGIRTAAMLGLARADGGKSFELLAEYLKKGSEELRIGAVRALAVIEGKKTRDILTSALYNEKVLEVRMEIDKALDGMKTGRNR